MAEASCDSCPTRGDIRQKQQDSNDADNNVAGACKKYSGNNGSTRMTNVSDKGVLASTETQEQEEIAKQLSKEKRPELPKPKINEPCPRCSSKDTKFCYYNNNNLKQPRFLCKGCQRFWTVGGILRPVPPGAGKRKTKYANAWDLDNMNAPTLAYAADSAPSSKATNIPLSVGAFPTALGSQPAGLGVSSMFQTPSTLGGSSKMPALSMSTSAGSQGDLVSLRSINSRLLVSRPEPLVSLGMGNSPSEFAATLAFHPMASNPSAGPPRLAVEPMEDGSMDGRRMRLKVDDKVEPAAQAFTQNQADLQLQASQLQALAANAAASVASTQSWPTLSAAQAPTPLMNTQPHQLWQQAHTQQQLPSFSGVNLSAVNWPFN
eukprot:gene10472-8432_t